MDGSAPNGKLKRGLIGGKAALRVGAKVAGYLVRKPFLSEEGRREARDRAERTAAQDVFSCFCLLKGTALKLAQLLSMELELVPDAVRKELEKACGQVPPMNRVLARKAAANALGRALEDVFGGFDSLAFAAASLGQVHAAESPEGRALAVKLQYPGIHRTIADDMRMIRGILGRLPEFTRIAPAIDEIEGRLGEETDYLGEARNMAFFRGNLHLDGVVVPEPWDPGCGPAILSATRMPGLPLNQWLATGPGPEERDIVASRLNEIFLVSFYGLHCIHADPNPGNYIVGPDLTVGLVDFGCVKSFSPEFVDLYRQLPRTIIQGRREEYFAMLRRMRFVARDPGKEAEEAIFACAYGFGRWLGRLYEVERFDFEKNAGFIAEGREAAKAMFRLREHFTMNADFVFLDRTRYGLLRLFEKLECRVRVRNAFEWGE